MSANINEGERFLLFVAIPIQHFVQSVRVKELIVTIKVKRLKTTSTLQSLISYSRLVNHLSKKRLDCDQPFSNPRVTISFERGTENEEFD